MRSLGPSQSPVVDKTFKQRVLLRESRNALAWGVLSTTLALMLYVLISTGGVEYHLSLSHPLILYTEYFLAIICTLVALKDFLQYLGVAFSASTVELTPLQKKLLGIKDADPGFSSASPKQAAESAGLILSPTTSFMAQSPQNVPYSPTGNPFSPLAQGRITPPSYNDVISYNGSGMFSHTPSPTLRTPSPLRQLSTSYTGSGVTHGGSFVSPSSSFTDFSPHASFSQSFNTSYGPRSANVSPLSATNNLSSLFHEGGGEGSALRNRFSSVSARSSPNTSGLAVLGEEDCISDQKSLQNFLREEEERERSQLSVTEATVSQSPSFWNFNRSMTDYTTILRKYQYQIATRSPQSTKSRDADPDDPATYRADEVWLRIGVYPHELELWTENIRKWLSQTILNRLSEEINKINKKLCRLGSEDTQIGEVSLSTLKQIAVTKAQHVPSLNAIVPYLECSANQEYLVKRIMDLGAGGAMSDFHWNGGTDFKGKAWSEHQPTDALIVMHALCCYMDSRLPPHPKYPDGKTFTSQYHLKTPDKPDFKKADNLLIYQSKVNPPHFKVIIGDDTWDLQKGRNNMFHAILLFLHHVNVKEHGMLGRVNLGMSGINIQWVLEKKL